MLKDLLYNIKGEIDNLKVWYESYQDETRNKMCRYQTLERCIEEKLDNTLTYYQDNLKQICDYVLSRNSFLMAKHLNKMANEENEEQSEEQEPLPF